MSESPDQPGRVLRRRSLSFVDQKVTDEARHHALCSNMAAVSLVQVQKEGDTLCLKCGHAITSDHCRTDQTEMHETPILPMIAAQHNEGFNLRDKIFGGREDEAEESVASTSSMDMLSEEDGSADEEGHH